MRKIRLVDEAEIELWNQVIYYEEQESGLGLDFEKEVRIAREGCKRESKR